MSVSMGNYETYTFEVNVGLGHGDVGLSEDDLVAMDDAGRDAAFQRLLDLVMTRLNDQLAGEIADASHLTLNEDSFVLAAPRLTPPSPQPKPKATTRKVRRS